MTADPLRPRDRLRFPRWGQRGTTGASIPAELAFDRVSQVYGSLRALDDVSLSIAAGELVCLLAQSGCGKTTLLRVAAGIESPPQGRILLDRREVTGPKLFLPPEARGIGLMFQDYALFPHLSIIENVTFGLRGLAAPGGEQQRVALARSIAPRPGILLMDEPFSNLDRRLRDAIRDETVAILRETGATTVVVTHDPEEAMRIADRIVLMQAGRIMQAGTAEEIYRRPADIFAARFFCDFTEVEGVGRGGRVETPVGLFPALQVADGAAAVVCIRPQGVRLKPAGFCLPGRLLSRRFLGEVELVQVAVQGLDHPLQARVRGPVLVNAGEDVGVEIDPDEVLVFAAGHP